MSSQYSTNNVYSQDGVLLIAKGQELTQDILERLHSRKTVEKDEIIPANKSTTISSCVHDIKKRFHAIDQRIIKKSSALLGEVVFCSRSSSLWLPVHALSNYVDWLYAHSIDVSLIALLIAIASGFSDEDQKDLCLGALLHDVGKLLVPKNIIEKPDKLTPQEMALVRQHCELGYGIVKDLGLSKNCTDIILMHHERLDGSGYPHRLTENEISEYAKIVMIADVIDAMTSYRPYKSAQDLQAGIQEMQKDGHKFDQKYLDLLSKYLT